MRCVACIACGRVLCASRYNEPDHDGSWVPPDWAASQWARMEQLQDLTGAQVVGPCVSNYGNGLWWLNTWTANCTALYGRPCRCVRT